MTRTTRNLLLSLTVLGISLASFALLAAGQSEIALSVTLLGNSLLLWTL